MKKLLLLFFGFTFCSIGSFGQTVLGFSPLPYLSGKKYALPSALDFRIPGSKWMSDSLVIPGKFPLSKNYLASGLDYSRKRSEAKVATSIISEEYNMPIIDLSKGFSSNLPIKKFSEDFPSNMPILGKKPVLPETLFENFNEDTNPKFLFDSDKQ
ncbi:hypothetical protein [Cyclobacterium jeungdonense]|uniref:Uncharacterized protein n=1 Tax=Cyclobacterium jeungdonense TaxID=708087 RepID=A0ABT8C8Y6_9BACT|nr:hypothetical protein [Cyclobacterium jeungdonense]MDN3688484.1 hypothetical protein [Cyclobacterium jeungdonense]